ncbi:MAG TPA: radical SAM protein, partial [Candidatus Paceibacterota bacterium]|nr:radical SAM protein [Candidatus Paceibacterota bacterium]
MAKDYDITINGDNFSSSLAAVTLSLSAEEQETTSFGAEYRQRISGLKDASISLDFHQDFGSASVDSTLYPLLGQPATVVVKPTSDAIGSTNPGFSAVYLVTEYSPYDSSVGDLATLSVTWPIA